MRPTSLLIFVATTLSSLVSALPRGLPKEMLLADGTAGTSPKDNDVPGINAMLMRNQSAPEAQPTADLFFNGSCQYVTLGGHGRVGQSTLEGRCVDGRGLWWETSLNLNLCIANAGGQLMYHEVGHFDDTCRPCLLHRLSENNRLFLQCNCLDTSGMPKYTALPFGQDVQNAMAVKPKDGRFICGKHEGTKAPIFAN